MTRIGIPSPDEADSESHSILSTESHSILSAVGKMFEFIPNVTRLLSLSPIALKAFVGLETSLAKALDEKTRGAVALAVSQANGCDYCMALHTYVTNNFAKVPPEEIWLNLEGKSSEPKIAAAATFGKRLIETRGKVMDADLADIRAAGFTEAQLVELIALTSQVLLTNFLNNVADTDIDIPPLKIGR